MSKRLLLFDLVTWYAAARHTSTRCRLRSGSRDVTVASRTHVHVQLPLFFFSIDWHAHNVLYIDYTSYWLFAGVLVMNKDTHQQGDVHNRYSYVEIKVRTYRLNPECLPVGTYLFPLLPSIHVCFPL